MALYSVSQKNPAYSYDIVTGKRRINSAPELLPGTSLGTPEQETDFKAQSLPPTFDNNLLAGTEGSTSGLESHAFLASSQSQAQLQEIDVDEFEGNEACSEFIDDSCQRNPGLYSDSGDENLTHIPSQYSHPQLCKESDLYSRDGQHPVFVYPIMMWLHGTSGLEGRSYDATDDFRTQMQEDFAQSLHINGTILESSPPRSEEHIVKSTQSTLFRFNPEALPFSIADYCPGEKLIQQASAALEPAETSLELSGKLGVQTSEPTAPHVPPYVPPHRRSHITEASSPAMSCQEGATSPITLA